MPTFNTVFKAPSNRFALHFCSAGVSTRTKKANCYFHKYFQFGTPASTSSDADLLVDEVSEICAIIVAAVE
jgi:hypothetical protein